MNRQRANPVKTWNSMDYSVGILPTLTEESQRSHTRGLS